MFIGEECYPRQELQVDRDSAKAASHVQEPAAQMPVQQMLGELAVHGHPAGQHSAVGGTPQFGLHDAAEAGLGAAMVVMRGSASTAACASLCAISRLDRRGLERARETRSESSRFLRS